MNETEPRTHDHSQSDDILDSITYDALKEREDVKAWDLQEEGAFDAQLEDIEPLSVVKAKDPKYPDLALLAVIGLGEGERKLQVWAPMRDGALSTKQVVFTNEGFNPENPQQGDGISLAGVNPDGTPKGDRLMFGRGQQETEEVLGPSSSGISRNHLEATIDPQGKLSLLDLGSTFGTTVLIKKRQPREASPQEVIPQPGSQMLVDSEPTPSGANREQPSHSDEILDGELMESQDMTGFGESLPKEKLPRPELWVTEQDQRSLEEAFDNLRSQVGYSTPGYPIDVHGAVEASRTKLEKPNAETAKALLGLMSAGAVSNDHDYEYFLTEVKRTGCFDEEDYKYLVGIIGDIQSIKTNAQYTQRNPEQVQQEVESRFYDTFSAFVTNNTPESLENNAVFLGMAAYGSGAMLYNYQASEALFGDVRNILAAKRATR